MSAQVGERLREASVVLSAAQRDAFTTAVDKLAGANPSMNDQLARLRLAFAVDPGAEAGARFDDQLAGAGVRIGTRDVQLRRTLAAAVLASRFGRPPGRRSLKTLAADTAAALGARLLCRALRSPVHPDVASWADYWVESLAMALREPRRLPSPPSFSPELPDAGPEESVGAHARRVVEELQSALVLFTDELASWSSGLDPAEVRAQGEQIDLLWWLASGEVPQDPVDLVVWAARGLRRHSRRIPGPPRTDQLIRRRLGGLVNESVQLRDVAARVSRPVSSAIADLCPLLSADDASILKRRLSVLAATEWLFDELCLAALVDETR